MRTLQELINNEEPGWVIVKEWIDQAKNKVEILPCDKKQAEDALVKMQVTTRSLMGAIVYQTGGLLIDGGWIRLLGAGCNAMNRSIASWNKGKTYQHDYEPAPYLLVADDVVGGLFAINGGYLGKDAGNMYYFAPDSLEWEALEISYTDFLSFCFNSDINKFYSTMRWDGWQDDMKSITPDQAYSFAPFLWTKEGKNIHATSRRAVAVQEIYNLNMEMKIKNEQ